MAKILYFPKQSHFDSKMCEESILANGHPTKTAKLEKKFSKMPPFDSCMKESKFLKTVCCRAIRQNKDR